VGFVKLLLVSGIGSTALVGPFALYLFWRKTSHEGFLAGDAVSQSITVDLLLRIASLPLWVDLRCGST
jgi:hypothetical protein